MALGTWLFAIVGGIVGVVLVLIGSGQLLAYLQVRRSHAVDVRSLTEQSGAVELAGKARPHETTSVSPFTGTDCLAYRWRIEEYRTIREPADLRSQRWNMLASGETVNQFLLADDTGEALIEPAGASMQLQTTTTIEVDADESPPRAVESFLASTDVVPAETDRKRHYHEARLDPGDDVHVLGPVRETGLRVDMPSGVTAIVGVEKPDERAFQVGRDGLADFIQHLKRDDHRFMIANSGETGAEGHLLKTGLLWVGAGLVFLALPIGLLVF